MILQTVPPIKLHAATMIVSIVMINDAFFTLNPPMSSRHFRPINVSNA